jgi:hypothetical protein
MNHFQGGFMKRSSAPRKTANLPESIHQQLNMYALAASAAGVGALCFAKPAEARIVYTPAHVAIKANGGLFRIDLDHDGSPDFGFSNTWTSNVSFAFRRLAVHPSQPTNEIWVTNSKACGGTASVVAALPKGKKIGPKGEFKHNPYGVMADATKATTCGVWARQSNLQAYLGLKFTINGKIHFGWARMKVDTLQRPFSAILTGYAYETIPGKAIVAGATKGSDDAEPTAAFSSHSSEPATLGALALGAPGLSIWRRDEPVAATSGRN